MIPHVINFVKEHTHTFLGTISSITLGAIFDRVGDLIMALLFGIAGGLGGWLFKRFLLPRLQRWFGKGPESLG